MRLLLEQVQECKSIQLPSNATFVPNGSLAHIICGHICEHIRMRGHLCAPCAEKHLPDNMIANATRGFIAAKRNLFAKENFVLHPANIGDVGEDLPERTP